MTLVSGKMRLDIPDSADDNSKVDFQYYLPSGDFDIQIDLSNYTPDDSDDGCTVSFYCTDSALTNYTQIRFRTDNGSPIYRSNITYRINSGTPQTGSIERSSIAPTILRVTRSGNDLTAYVFVIGTGWISLGTVDFGAYASEPDIVKIILGDTNNRGGYVDFDNLTFNSCCPTGYPKAWTTTTTTTTTTCTTTSTAPP